MTLHKAVEMIKKIGIGMGIGIGVLLILFVFFRIGAFVIGMVTPPKITPPNVSYDVLPQIQFPESKTDNTFTYVLNTISGTLPSDIPDRVHVYKVQQPSPSLLNLEEARVKAEELGFTDEKGDPSPEISLGNGKYQWSEQRGMNRKLIFDILTFNFSITSDYLATLTVLGAENLSDENNAVQTARELLDKIELLPEDIDFEQIQTPQDDTTYNTYPKLFTIRNGALIPTTSLSTAQVIRVDLYQKDVEYDLDTGRDDAEKVKMKMPIRYPNPPYSTMSFWIGSGQSQAEVGAMEFIHHSIDLSGDNPATYPIKKPEEAYEELKNGSAYIASYQGLDQEILISNVYLAYYLGEENSPYLMPIFVFEGQNGFFAYVPAVTDEWVE